MKIIKRSGAEVIFDREKIVTAIRKANEQVDSSKRLSEANIHSIADDIEIQCHKEGHALNVEDIQDLVETGIMEHGAYEVAKLYIKYRFRHEQMRKSNTTDQQIMTLLEENNEEVKQENSNKNPTVVSVQRDYMAGEVSKDITRRFLVDPEIARAHAEGLIPFHDADYFAQHMHNCDLVNLEDMLQNGTVISGTRIDRPHSFSTACNIATQIIAQVASCQYGGQSISLSHLAPFFDVRRKKIEKDVQQT
ncbi:MAG: anaerobic ribonucleoside-triphosphate reductase, partial [Treponema sp.]|nr:anaerobic ribonucleoside-triphosphate reductase [Treponema sp.]